MSNDNTTKVSMDELNKIQDLTDWEKVKLMTPEEIENLAQDDPDCQPTDDEFWSNANVIKPDNHKIPK